MYTIILTPTTIHVYNGTYRDYVLANGSRGCEPLKQCTTKVEVKQSIRQFVKSYNREVDCPFSLVMSRYDQYKLGVSTRFSEDAIYKMKLAKLGSKNPNFGGLKEEARRKLSIVRKGKSNHTGKKHRVESRMKTAHSMKGKKNALGWRWIHNYDMEKRIKGECPVGWKRGRLPGFMKGVQMRRWK